VLPGATRGATGGAGAGCCCAIARSALCFSASCRDFSIRALSSFSLSAEESDGPSAFCEGSAESAISADNSCDWDHWTNRRKPKTAMIARKEKMPAAIASFFFMENRPATSRCGFLFYRFGTVSVNKTSSNCNLRLQEVFAMLASRRCNSAKESCKK
jgi:hypothetical protein